MAIHLMVSEMMPAPGVFMSAMGAMGSLVGHLIFGAILGTVFLWMPHRAVHPAAG